MTLNSIQNQRKAIFPFTIVASALLAITVIAATCNVSCSNKSDQAAKEAETATDTTLVTEPQDSVVIDLTGEDSVSVFALLQRDHNVEYKSTAMGVFVTGIDGLKNGSGIYWIYTVNDTTPQSAGDRVLTKSGDRVQWHYRKQK